MPLVLLLRPREVVKAFEYFGWIVARQHASHIIMVKEDHIAALATQTVRRLPKERFEV